MEYYRDRCFLLWAYSTCHNTLVIRSKKEYQDPEKDKNVKPNPTIDIEFCGVSKVNLPNSLKDIEISKIPIDDFNNKYIINNNYYVIAEGCIIGESNWDSDTCRIDDFKLGYKKVVMSA